MREIKFRMWTGIKMIYDIEQVYNCLIQQVAFYADVKYPIPYDHADDGTVFQQYTGLKDKNEKEIYEGDIIQMKHPYKDRQYSGVVSWEGYMWSCKEFFFTHFDIPSEIFSDGTEYVEIIGNIYENPELLK